MQISLDHLFSVMDGVFLSCHWSPLREQKSICYFFFFFWLASLFWNCVLKWKKGFVTSQRGYVHSSCVTLCPVEICKNCNNNKKASGRIIFALVSIWWFLVDIAGVFFVFWSFSDQDCSTGVWDEKFWTFKCPLCVSVPAKIESFTIQSSFQENFKWGRQWRLLLGFFSSFNYLLNKWCSVDILNLRLRQIRNRPRYGRCQLFFFFLNWCLSACWKWIRISSLEEKEYKETVMEEHRGWSWLSTLRLSMNFNESANYILITDWPYRCN